MAKKVVLVGDGATGKTTLLLTATTGNYTTTPETESTKFETKVRVGDRECLLDFYDTNGQEENQKQRIAVYPHTDVFIIAFSIVSPYSFDSVLTKWHPEINRYAPGVPVLLVGTKLDIRNDPYSLERLSGRKLAPISYQQGREMKEHISALSYVECSAQTGEGLPSLLEAVLHIADPPAAKTKAQKRKSKVKEKKEVKKDWAVISVNGHQMVEGEIVAKNKNQNCSVL
uniref:Uncharacterized protein n=1 Tax=Arcella intermedia TaxID=1963864 RepID=A0A6B2LHR7_9EUKA